MFEETHNKLLETSVFKVAEHYNVKSRHYKALTFPPTSNDPGYSVESTKLSNCSPNWQQQHRVKWDRFLCCQYGVLSLFLCSPCDEIGGKRSLTTVHLPYHTRC